MMMNPIFHRAANLLKHYRENGRLLDVGTGLDFSFFEVLGDFTGG
jgi:hypothetical protein